MLYELLVFFGLFTPDSVKLEHSDTEKLVINVSQEQFDHVFKLLKENPDKKEAFDKYLESIDPDIKNKSYKLMLRFKK